MVGTPFSDEWVSTYSPEVRDLAEAKMASVYEDTGEPLLGQCWLYAVPRAWADAHPDWPREMIWRYPAGSIHGEPYVLKGTEIGGRPFRDNRMLGDL